MPMSKQHNFHSLYGAPLVVGIVLLVLGAGLTVYLADRPLSPPANTLQASSTPEARERIATDEPDLSFPTDPATQQLLREYLADAAAANAKHQGTAVRVVSLVALVEPSGDVELYGAPH